MRFSEMNCKASFSLLSKKNYHGLSSPYSTVEILSADRCFFVERTAPSKIVPSAGRTISVHKLTANIKRAA